MDHDEVMLYVKRNPDCTSLDLAREFGVTVAKAFTFMNKMYRKGLIVKTEVRSPTNNKKILGYRVIPGYDEPKDNEDGSIDLEEAKSILRRAKKVRGGEIASLHQRSMNEWREYHGVETIDDYD